MGGDGGQEGGGPEPEPPTKRQHGTEEDKDGEAVYSDTNGFPLAMGRGLHLGLAKGELASRVVVVGAPARAKMLAGFLEPENPNEGLFTLATDRGFTTYTGLFEGRRLSVCSIGMGLPMMDFVLREGRAVVEGPMAVVRWGTCGVLQRSVKPGTVSVATEGSIVVQNNFFGGKPDEVAGGGKPAPYLFSAPCLPDAELDAAVSKALGEALGADQVANGLNVTADSFYSSQGRRDPRFADNNEGLMKELARRHPSALSMEMESFMLLHLARNSRPEGHLRAAAAAVNVANRATGEVVDAAHLKATERDGGKAMMSALCAVEL